MAYKTYHCLCSELIVALPKPLEQLPRREGDGSHVCEGGLTTVNALSAEDATIMKLDDGFEKRYPVVCRRCDLPIGYHLDLCQFEDSKSSSGPRSDVLYILSGALQSTESLQGDSHVSGVAQTSVVAK
ncbi:hypothetical protein KC332_g1005 [Hortaea werneckii]|uniref:STEEP1 domain-containing protein n=1 Tax=Hortaea werneckii EXF-2000 TaxID=1157616 RepID=A0A1Z5SUZ8_HORWE|nr:hypothetical protein KC350_g6664 [Hortaea werneckii]OTA24643.1 hypothetical protein BTJ68_11853 [Hortaea werneckii EXF-2000]KAI7071860.1 hypothetical protein KC327_g7189 [Hortaea werneckii]KAI7136137.1 hypothetical protein KC337_g2458 [Hortaea werneckii]KAI7243358.1 hypothetical protein KC365_g2372 [Hortaea werneckii]